jgi:desulfoferrodoxin-like iron-binding protein
MAEMGKRYQCDKCGTVVLAIKGGDGELACCAQPMATVDPKAIPSGD